MAGLCLLFSSLSYCRPFKTISSLRIVPSSARYPKRAYQNSPSSAPNILIGHHNVADDHGKESGKIDGVLICQLSRKSEVRRPTVLAVAECDGHWERMVVKDSCRVLSGSSGVVCRWGEQTFPVSELFAITRYMYLPSGWWWTSLQCHLNV